LLFPPDSRLLFSDASQAALAATAQLGDEYLRRITKCYAETASSACPTRTDNRRPGSGDEGVVQTAGSQEWAAKKKRKTVGSRLVNYREALHRRDP
jgi:hypothetical protein